MRGGSRSHPARRAGTSPDDTAAQPARRTDTGLLFSVLATVFRWALHLRPRNAATRGQAWDRLSGPKISVLRLRAGWGAPSGVGLSWTAALRRQLARPALRAPRRRTNGEHPRAAPVAWLSACTFAARRGFIAMT